MFSCLIQAVLRKISDLQKSLIYYNVNENVTVMLIVTFIKYETLKYRFNVPFRTKN